MDFYSTLKAESDVQFGKAFRQITNGVVDGNPVCALIETQIGGVHELLFYLHYNCDDLRLLSLNDQELVSPRSNCWETSPFDQLGLCSSSIGQQLISCKTLSCV